MKIRYIIILLLLLPISLQASKFRIYTEFSGISSYIDENTGEISGFSVDIVREIQKRTGDNSTIELLPWARGYMYLKKGPQVILFQTTRTKARNDMFKWVGPLSNTSWAFFALKKNKIKIKSLDDAKKLKAVGCYKDDVKESYLKSKGFKNIVSAYGENASLTNLMNLKYEKVDLIIMSNAFPQSLSRTHNIDISDIEKVFDIKTFYFYIAFSHDTPNTVIQKWQKALNSIKSDGTYLKIIKKYKGWESYVTFAKPGTF